MKPTAVFVNTARGPLVVEADLADALRKGVIFAAGLDVTDPEPPHADNPLLTLPNCVVAPHIASATVSSRNAMAEIAADNLIAGLEGEAAARLGQSRGGQSPSRMTANPTMSVNVQPLNLSAAAVNRTVPWRLSVGAIKASRGELYDAVASGYRRY